jgi:hypothetical protein
MQQLIQIHYPGTKLSVSEWSSSDDTDITGGLVTADSLGLFGVYGLDQATYWSQPDQLGPVGLAYWLFRGYVTHLTHNCQTHPKIARRNGTHFGDNSVQVNMAEDDADILGVYASTDENKKVTMVVINKDVIPHNLAISNIPAGKYFLRHFGGAAGVAKWQVSNHVRVCMRKSLWPMIAIDNGHYFGKQQLRHSFIHGRLLPATVSRASV